MIKFSIYRPCAAIAVAWAVCSLFTATIAHAAPPDWRPWEAARARIHADRMVILERQYHPYMDNIQGVLDQEQANLKDALRNLCADTRPEPRLGVRIDAYISHTDDSAQPFVRYLPPQWSPDTPSPLIVYLHGYAPFDRFNLPFFPSYLTNTALQVSACIAVPFARGNTDFQGIGEVDVIRVMDEMRQRYNTDPRRVVLIGHSMGGMGAWSVAARHPHLFNAVMVLAGRGDFYVWHKLRPDDLPPWQRRLVDTQFASVWVHQMKNLPLLALHGTSDLLVSYEQGKAIFEQLKPHNQQAEFIPIANGDHWDPLVYLTNDVGRTWLTKQLTTTNKHDFVSRIGIGESGSRLQNALQEPFVFVGGTSESTDSTVRRNLKARAHEWAGFAQATPRIVMEPDLTPSYTTNLNLFVFGEPETSPLIKRVFDENNISVTAETYRIGERSFPRDGNGLWFTATSPFNTNRTVVVQCGLRWGASLPQNHLYDRIPDVIVYTEAVDFYKTNIALGAGFINSDGTIDWSDPATTPAIRPRSSLPLSTLK
ncbi:MAG: alpha/beta fold hydrolase [Lentisphaerae bacterium]|nr:alpha/beta fold hydrolase [Lentisphaerota bacterium]